MEIDSCMDQYEKQLYALFQSYDSTQCGTLNREALVNLCDSLQLEDRGRELTNLLLGDSNEIKVAFSQFRDGLLSVLGGEASNEKSMKILERTEILSGEDSSGREVSPKYIFGSKKYGRRSRPAQAAESPEGLYSDTIQETDNSSLETAESDITPTLPAHPDKAMGNKKRRTNNKLRRSISFTGNRKHDNVDCGDFKKFSTNYKEVSICVDEGSKNINQDTPDCQRLHNDICTGESRPHLKGVDCNSNNQDVFSPLCAFDEHKNGIILKNNPHACSQSETEINLASKSTSHTQIYSEDSESSMTSCTIGELWESAGVFKPFQLLNDLGFKGDSAKVAQVILVLEEEIKSITSNMHASSIQNSLTTLTQAVLSLYQHETKALRTTASQTSAERDKLKADLLDANQRAILLAHEVDDNHTKMEIATRNTIKLLEQKHSDTLKQLSSRFATEKEQLSLNICNLESKISKSQSEELKLKTQLTSSEKKITFYEKELNNLQEQLSELVEVKKQLSKEIKILTSEKQYSNTKDNSSPKMDTHYLESQLSKLANENTLLRDKNDEAIAELENFYLKISNSREKIKITPLTCLVDIPPELELLSSNVKGKIKESNDADFSGVNGIKRRGGSPSHSHTNFSNGEESPRICKVRKCRRRKLLSLEIDSHPNDLSSCSMEATFECTNSNEHSNIDLKSELAPMEERIDVLCFKHIADENISKIIGILEDTKCKTLADFFQLSCVKHYYLVLFWILERIRNDIIEIKKKRSYSNKEFSESSPEILLQNIVGEVKASLSQNIIDNLCCDAIDLNNQTICKTNLSLQDDIMEVETVPNQISNCNNQSVDDKISNLITTIDQLQSVIESERKSRDEEKAKDAEKCSVLETNLELLKTEFDKCEDYWASKLDDERDIFDQEQRMSDEKFAELLSKVAEYEEQFASHDNKNDQSNRPLSTIEEKYNLEKQFTDLEDEFEEHKLKSEIKNQHFVIEIDQLKEQIKHLENTKIVEIVNQPVSESEFCVYNNDSNKNTEANVTDSDVNKELSNGSIKSLSNPFSPSNNMCESKVAFPVENGIISNINSPINYLWNQSTIPSLLPNVRNNSENARDYHNPAFVKDQLTQNTNNILKEMPNQEITRNIAPIQKPIFLKSYSNMCQESFQQNKFGEYKLDKKMLQCSELEETLQGRRNEGRSGGRPRADVEIKSMSQRIPPQHPPVVNGFKAAALEQRCRQLQIALRQQQSYTEAVMQQTVAAHRGEVGALKQQLAAADILVRDLYIENCHLARSLVAPGTQ